MGDIEENSIHPFGSTLVRYTIVGHSFWKEQKLQPLFFIIIAYIPHGTSVKLPFLQYICSILKKLTAISFLLIFLCANTEMGQLLKLPVLIHHYLEHHDDDEGVSFVNFLHKHYYEENSHPSPNNEHEKLPFKSHELGFSQATFIYQPPVGFELQIEKLISKVNIIYSTAFHQTSILSRIWQPPKFC